jgi:hypothetical protein
LTTIEVGADQNERRTKPLQALKCNSREAAILLEAFTGSGFRPSKINLFLDNQMKSKEHQRFEISKPPS